LGFFVTSADLCFDNALTAQYLQGEGKSGNAQTPNPSRPWHHCQSPLIITNRQVLI